MNQNTCTISKPEAQIVRQGTAPKLSPYAKGLLEYEIGISEQAPSIRITKNQSGGAFSREWVPIGVLKDSIPANAHQGQAFHLHVFREVITSGGQNTPGFIAAVLRQEGVLKSSPEKIGQVHLSGNWDKWVESFGRKSVPPSPNTEQAQAPEFNEALFIEALRKPSKRGKLEKSRKHPLNTVEKTPHCAVNAGPTGV